ncbi:MAG: sigma-54-dependent Fis family transcriptional regulator [Gammaproteobacteria bacterium]|nr:sigma-54-dependent Fis family transcriptional regulator [Gammaproteobacteria bacterium]MBK8990259.1 sigma-54-dependent Fis family transcriptional regulator [Gammaproteobacteria bacterium]MBK9469184.1 sigma-54-dependent Fis family transcriptional regulator [Gammaproteobacteria bacterium]MBP7911217.1 sigma-54-dependent Fis family transcriptional regulator [Pseudomonadales bacterium]
MSSPAILIIDDEPDIRELLAMTVRRMGLDAFCAESLDGARRMLEKRRFDFCLTDMKLPDGTGLQLIEHVQQNHEGMPVAVITAFGSIELAIDSMKAGAFDFLTKPIDLERLRNLVSNALRLGEATATLQCPEQVQLLGDTEPMVHLRQQIVRLARSQAPVYITGESGTGKELVARLIHANGARAAGPFVPVNCGAIPGELMESEFFGHRKGSFTGAVADKQGLFQAANGGTLFLDEVADLPLPMQVKLLRAIQEKAVRAVGTEQEIRVDVRILSATHKNLGEEVEQGLFRRDLFYRINVIELRVPSLRERAADIALIAEACIRRLAEEYNTAAPRLHEDALQALLAYAFPGNVRELENILERAFTLCDGNVIRAPDLRLPGANPVAHSHAASEPAAELDALAELPNVPLEEYLEGIERRAIMRALELERWNRTAAAKRLGMTFRSLRYRLKKLGID